MDPVKLGSGDNQSAQILYGADKNVSKPATDFTEPFEDKEKDGLLVTLENKVSTETITIQVIEDHENRLKDRIFQCRNLIEALKVELNEEKAKIEKETRNQEMSYEAQILSVSQKPQLGPMKSFGSRNQDFPSSDDFFGDFAMNSSVYSTCVDSKLNCDESLMEYEKQLEQYQTTLNMAQLEKKNAIRKKMLTKAYRLKLLEIENQCNIELLRVKQSLQCLEPLALIANKWKTESEEACNPGNYELMPPFPELNSVTSTHCFNDLEGGKENAIDFVDADEKDSSSKNLDKF